MILLGLDPGKSTGYALIEIKDGDIGLLTMGIEKDEQVALVGELILKSDKVICEDFKLRPNMARSGAFDYDNLVASRVIGKIELLCQMAGTELVKQQASLKPMAYGFAGMKYQKGKKGMHWQDAFSHAVYFAVKNQLASPLKHAPNS